MRPTPRWDLLKAAGYRFECEFGTYFNRKMKVVFSAEFVDAHSVEEIGDCLKKIKPRKGWQFFSLQPLHRAVRKEIEAAYSA
jgi:hypothetical protein